MPSLALGLLGPKFPFDHFPCRALGQRITEDDVFRNFELREVLSAICDQFIRFQGHKLIPVGKIARLTYKAVQRKHFGLHSVID